MNNEMYGFETAKGLTFLKAYPEDVDTIVRLYSTETGEFGRAGREKLKEVWMKELAEEEDDFNNCSFLIRDKCKKVIGMVTFETKDAESFEFFIWLPNGAKRVRWQDHIHDSLVEFAQDCTDIKEVKRILSLTSFKAQKAIVLGKDYKFAS